MADSDTINFSEDHEVNTVLGNVGARQTIANRALVRLLGDVFKEQTKVRVISDRAGFYAFIKEHATYPLLEKKAAGE